MIQMQGLEQELYDEIRGIPVVDCHEHLPTEAERLQRPVDVTTLFSHYCKADLEAAGLKQGAPQQEVFDVSKPLRPRWQKLKPYFEAIRFGSYAFPAFAYVRDALGIDDIDDDTVEEISRRLSEDNRPGLYKKTLQDLCGIETAIQCVQRVIKGDQPFFVYLCADRAAGFGGAGRIEQLERETGRAIHSLDACVEAIRDCIARQKAEGAVGLKISAAYQRKIEFPNTPRCAAEPIYNRIGARKRSQLSDGEMTLLENYLVRREVEACIECGLVVAIHTGYQAGNRNDIRNTRATHLWSLLNDYPDARFDLYHGSTPYIADMNVLGKYFENVTLNMCWMHIMGPEMSRRALREWLDAVPVTKLFAFGGDYQVVEKVYGHLTLARWNVAVVLAESIRAGRMTREQALRVARLWFHDNPKRWYGF